MLHRFKNVVARCVTRTQGSIHSKRGARVGVRFTPFGALDVDDTDKVFADAIEVFPADSRAADKRLWPPLNVARPAAPAVAAAPAPKPVPVMDPKPVAESVAPVAPVAPEDPAKPVADATVEAPAEVNPPAETPVAETPVAETPVKYLDGLNAKKAAEVIDGVTDLNVLDAIDREERAAGQRVSVLRAIEQRRNAITG